MSELVTVCDFKPSSVEACGGFLKAEAKTGSKAENGDVVSGSGGNGSSDSRGDGDGGASDDKKGAMLVAVSCIDCRKAINGRFSMLRGNRRRRGHKWATPPVAANISHRSASIRRGSAATVTYETALDLHALPSKRRPHRGRW